MVRRTPEQLALAIRRRTNAELDRLAAEVERAHDYREDQCTTVPIRERGKNIRRVPNTALIAYAAQRAAVRRQLQQIIKWGVEHSGAPPYIAREDYSQAIAIVEQVLSRLQPVEHP